MWLMVGVALLLAGAGAEWRCPGLSARPAAECSCDLPHTLRCAGDHTALQIIGRHLREQRAKNKNTTVSLLDCALRGVSALTAASITELAGVGLHGLVISSGDIRRVQSGAFNMVAGTLLALGLPNNQLPSVPTEALAHLSILDRLDLSNNKIHVLDRNSFKGVQNMTYLDLSDNQLTDITPGAFRPLERLAVLKLRGNLLKVAALASLKEAHFLRDLDLSSNALEGPLGPNTVPPLPYLTNLQLSDNTFASIRRGALSGLTNLTHLTLHNNQIDVLEDYAFRHLLNLTHLDLSHNEIVAVSGASLAQLANLVHLDLSHNFLRSISAEPLKSLQRLSELMLHDNDISMIDDGALAQYPQLTRFTIEGNLVHLEVDLSHNFLRSIFAEPLKSLQQLAELVLYDNDISMIDDGALAQHPQLTRFTIEGNLVHLEVDLSHNFLRSISAEPLKSLQQLAELVLHDNDISMIDDDALAQHPQLTRLTIEGNLVHLEVDLSYNFLRSISAEPLKSLQRLSELMLHDNDISMIDDGAPAQLPQLTRFTMEDNPLNCDCLMAGYARWLREAKYLSQADKAAAVCTTPPHLEGALISRLSKNKLCDDFEHVEKIEVDYKIVNTVDDSVKEYEEKGLDDDMYDDEMGVPGEEDLPISKAKVSLLDAWFDDQEVYLSWAVDPPSTHRFRCTGVTVARGGGLPKQVACHRAAPANVVLRGLKIDPVDQYTFCIALEEMDSNDNPQALVLGCGAPQMVRQRAPFVTPVPVPVTLPISRDNLRVTEVRSNVTSDGLLTVVISMMGLPTPRPFILPRSQRLSSATRLHNCYVVLAVLSRGSLVAQKDTPCQSTLEISMEGFLRGPYEVCATLSKYKADDTRSICIVPQVLESGSLEMKANFKSLNVALVGVALGLMVIVVGLVWFVRKMLKKPTQFEPHRCFRQEPVQEETPRSNYVMLTATSKV